MINATAIIHPKANVDPSVTVGPYAVIDEHVTVGPGCVIGPYVYITGHTQIGANNRFHAGCVIGDGPQSGHKYRDQPSRLLIGENNIFREQVTVHCSNNMSSDTCIGSGNYIMAHVHVAHNVTIGNEVTLANGAVLGGHVTIADSVFISANCLVHPFTRVGTLALMAGGERISMDLPPFTVAFGINGICGLNSSALRRAGMRAAERLELRALYHDLFRSGQNLPKAVAAGRLVYQSEPARILLEFVANSKRGICRDLSSKRNNPDVASL